MTVAPRFAELQVSPAEFIPFLKTAFAMKRKTLLNNLKKDFPEEVIRNGLKEAGARADVRAEALPLETMARIFRKLAVKQP
jgi:16S rRNA (adenine1518-N6/adenine1519-N6)-dimethyltransferase